MVRSQCSTASKSGKPAAAATQEDGSVFHMSENSLNLCLLGASLGGMTLGWYMREPGVSSRLLLFMAFPAELYVRMLECLVLPVVTSSIVAALGSIDIVLAGHIGLIAMLYFVVATGTASAIGIGLGLALGLPSTPCWNRRRLTQIDGFLDFLRNIFPDNYVEACLYTTATVGRNFTDQDSFETVREHRANILGLLSVSVMVGCILSVTVSESDVLLNLFVGLSNATVTVSHLASWYSPVGVFFLVATQLAQLRQLDGLLSSIRAFVLASLVGLGAYGLLLLPGLYALVTGQDPRRILRITSSPALKAFRSASRTVSVPDTIEALEEVAGLEPRIVRFVIPVGANVSMSGTALVASAAAVVLAELDGLEVGAEEILIIGDRFRTTVNIYSDSVGSAIVQQFSRLDPIEDSLEESPVGMAPPGLRPPPEFGPETEGALSEEIDMDQDVEVVRLSEAKRLSAPSSPAERSPGRRPSVAWSDRRLVNLVYNTDCVSCLPEPPLLAPTPTTGSRRPSCSFDVTPWGGSPAEVGSGASHSGICSPHVAPPQPPASLLGDWKEDLPAEESPHSDDDSAGTASGSRSPRHRHHDTTSTTTSEGLQKSSSLSSPKGRKSRRHSKSRRHRSEHGSPEVMVTPATTPPRYATCAGSGSVSAEDPDTPPAGLV